MCWCTTWPIGGPGSGWSTWKVRERRSGACTGAARRRGREDLDVSAPNPLEYASIPLNFGAREVNRAPWFNERLAELRRKDNYFNKIFLMLQISERQGYEWILSAPRWLFRGSLGDLSEGGSGSEPDKYTYF